MNHSARFALIASLCAAHHAAPAIPADVELMPLPSRATGSRFSREDRQDNRAELAADLLAYRIKQDLSRPRNPFALALV